MNVPIELRSPFANDMFSMLWIVCRRIWPEVKCKCQWTEDIFTPYGEEAYGETVFPEDGTEPVISISAQVPVVHAVEILAHELAHVAAGEGHDHDEVWENAFQALNDAYCEFVSVSDGWEAALKRLQVMAEEMEE